MARFEMEKDLYLAGEPVFCRFTIRNTGARAFAFAYRFPSRVLNPELESEPRFAVTTEKGERLPDPAPQPCGGARGSVVYGMVSLPPGQAHSERWLLNQWATLSSPGEYCVRAERHLPLLAWDAATEEFSEEPAAYALAVNELAFRVVQAKETQLQGAFEPYLKAVDDPKAREPTEAVLVLTTLPRSFFLQKLVGLTLPPVRDRRWDPQQGLEGLARLGTPEAWQAILSIARGVSPARTGRRKGGPAPGTALRAYAILLLGQKGDRAFLPALLELASRGPEDIRGDVLRALGSFDDPRANEFLFQRLRSPSREERVNAILGLRNLERRDVVPALIGMLNDSDARVRQVAHFALRSLTGQEFQPPGPSPRDALRAARQWQDWWRENGAKFTPVAQPPCRDW